MKYRIGHRDYVVRPMRAAKAKKLDGETDFARGVIELSPRLTPDTERETLLHELLHACMWESGLSQRLGHDLDEDLATNLSRWLIMLLRDNPGLAARLGAA